MFFDPTDPYKHIGSTDKKEEQEPPIKTWSVSMLQAFRRCQYRVYLRYVLRKKPKRFKASDRGNNIHQEAEDFIQGKTDRLSDTFKHFKNTLEGFKERYPNGKISIEEKWAFDPHWVPVDYKDPSAQCKMILDVGEFESETSYVITDWKSGKKFGNEIKHTEQGIIYAVGAVHKYPQIQHVAVQFKYIDKNDKLEREYTRNTLVKGLTPIVNKNSNKLLSCKTFLPNPGRSTCGYCGFYENGCQWGTTDN